MFVKFSVLGGAGEVIEFINVSQAERITKVSAENSPDVVYGFNFGGVLVQFRPASNVTILHHLGLVLT